ASPAASRALGWLVPPAGRPSVPASTGFFRTTAARTRSPLSLAYGSDISFATGTSANFGSPRYRSRSAQAIRRASTRACTVAGRGWPLGSRKSHVSQARALRVARTWSTVSPPAVGGGVWIVWPRQSRDSGVTSAGLYAARAAAV